MSSFDLESLDENEKTSKGNKKHTYKFDRIERSMSRIAEWSSWVIWLSDLVERASKSHSVN